MIKALRLLQEQDEEDQEMSVSGDDSSGDEDDGSKRSRDSLSLAEVEEQFLHMEKELNKEIGTMGKKRGRCFRYLCPFKITFFVKISVRNNTGSCGSRFLSV